MPWENVLAVMVIIALFLFVLGCLLDFSGWLMGHNDLSGKPAAEDGEKPRNGEELEASARAYDANSDAYR